MQSFEGEGIKEMVTNHFKRLQEWVKPNPSDTALIQSPKMIYKAMHFLF